MDCVREMLFTYMIFRLPSYYSVSCTTSLRLIRGRKITPRWAQWKTKSRQIAPRNISNRLQTCASCSCSLEFSYFVLSPEHVDSTWLLSRKLLTPVIWELKNPLLICPNPSFILNTINKIKWSYINNNNKKLSSYNRWTQSISVDNIS